LIALEAETALATFRADTASGTVIALTPPWSARADDAGCPAAAAGQLLGRYRLIERLGQGSQGEVWRAIETGPGGREVALKVLPPAQSRDRRRMAQFRHEAERGRRISGPALLPTLDHGVSAEGIPFMAMPLVDGCSLVDVLARRRDPSGASVSPARLHRLALATEADYLRGVVRVVARVARGLAMAHAADVVHRDIKPANILLDRRREGEGFLCDFGLGRDLDIATPAQLRDGAGTPLYMAPERLLRRHADEMLSDIYALGATLFEALTFVPPIAIPEGLPWDSWAIHLAAARPGPPSARRGGIPADLDAIVMKAMARRPDRRYASANLLADDLDRFLAGGSRQ
jgi:eukaryotic-like serine/threonine-protein kinase